MLELVRLAHFEERATYQLSGGQQQRVALARSLVTDPTILLLDEPLGALDKNLRERMQFELRQIQKRLGITSILVTHDQEEALTMSDRVAVMSEGEIVQIGTPTDVYDRPRTQFVSEFLGTANIFEGVVVGEAEPGSWRMRPRTERRRGPRLWWWRAGDREPHPDRGQAGTNSDRLTRGPRRSGPGPGRGV